MSRYQEDLKHGQGHFKWPDQREPGPNCTDTLNSKDEKEMNDKVSINVRSPSFFEFHTAVTNFIAEVCGGMGEGQTEWEAQQQYSTVVSVLVKSAQASAETSSNLN